jgi:hypothetical protein
MATDFEKYFNRVSAATEAIANKRGEAIDIAIEVENNLTDIISWCFCPSKHSGYEIPASTIDESGITLKSLLLSRIDFRDKIEIFKDVILAKQPQVFKNNKAQINTIVKELDKVRKFRNLLAHSESDLLSLSDDTGSIIVDEFQVVEYRKGQVIRHSISKDKYESEIKTMLGLVLKLWILFGLFGDDSDVVKKYQEMLNKA